MDYLYKYWAIFGGIAAVSILLIVYTFSHTLTSVESLLWVHFSTLLIHQFEEYIYPGGFKDFFNNHLYNKNRVLRHPLTNKGIIMVNVIIGWTAYGVSAIYGLEQIWLAIGLCGITILNGVLHTMMYLIHKKYNPGFYSGLFLFIPFGIYLLFILLNKAPSENISSGVMILIIGIILIPSSIFIANKISR